MKAWQYLISIFSLLVLLGAGCVSVNIKPSAPTRSSDYKLREPQAPFVKMTNEQADQAWQSSQSGNTIAVLSECSEQKDPSLLTLESETIQALTNYQVISSESFQFQDRGARRSLVEGTVDGIPVRMDVVVVKKNACSYTLTYMGRANGFEKDRSAFEQFLMGFEIR